MNTLSLTVLDDTRIQTDLATSDGVSEMKIHKNKNDEKILIEIARNDYYKQYSGDWELTLASDSKTFFGKEITDVIHKALAFINDRDNPDALILSYF